MRYSLTLAFFGLQATVAMPLNKRGMDLDSFMPFDFENFMNSHFSNFGGGSVQSLSSSTSSSPVGSGSMSSSLDNGSGPVVNVQSSSTPGGYASSYGTSSDDSGGVSKFSDSNGVNSVQTW